MKLENVLFESKARTRIKIVDFGIAGTFKNNSGERTDAGTIRYMPPEVLKGSENQANPAIDIWAMGVMLYCMIYFKYPFNGDTHQIIIDKIINQELKFPNATPHTTTELQDLIRGLLDKDHAKRLTLFDIQTHVWMRMLDDEILDKIEEVKKAYEE